MVNLSEGYNYSSALEDESLYKIYKEYGEKIEPLFYISSIKNNDNDIFLTRYYTNDLFAKTMEMIYVDKIFNKPFMPMIEDMVEISKNVVFLYEFNKIILDTTGNLINELKDIVKSKFNFERTNIPYDIKLLIKMALEDNSKLSDKDYKSILYIGYKLLK